MHQYVSDLVSSGDEYVVCFLADSSPRVGREWMLSEWYVISASKMELFLLCMEELVSMKEEGDTDVTRKEELEETLASCIRRHVMLPATGQALHLTRGECGIIIHGWNCSCCQKGLRIHQCVRQHFPLPHMI